MQRHTDYVPAYLELSNLKKVIKTKNKIKLCRYFPMGPESLKVNKWF